MTVRGKTCRPTWIHYPNSEPTSARWTLNTNQSFLFLLNAVCLAKKQQIPIFIVFGSTRSGLEPTIYRTRCENADHYTTDAILLFGIFFHNRKKTPGSWRRPCFGKFRKKITIKMHE